MTGNVEHFKNDQTRYHFQEYEQETASNVARNEESAEEKRQKG